MNTNNNYQSAAFQSLENKSNTNNPLRNSQGLYGSVSPGQAYREYWHLYNTGIKLRNLNNNNNQTNPQNTTQSQHYLPYHQVAQYPPSSIQNQDTQSQRLQNNTPNPIKNQKEQQTTSNIYPRVEVNNEEGLNDWVLLDEVPPSPLATQVSLRNSNVHTSTTKTELDALEYLKSLFEYDYIDTKLVSERSLQGIPPELRAPVWQLLLGQLSPIKNQRNEELRKKRSEYISLIQKYWHPSNNLITTHVRGEIKHVSSENIDEELRIKFGKLYYIVAVDVMRTHPTGFVSLFDNPAVKHALQRILFIWACENQDISYFQGLNDLTCPFFIVYMTYRFGKLSDHNNEYKTNTKIKECLDLYLPSIEADVYWSVTMLLKGMKTYHPLSTGGVFAEAMMSEFRILMEAVDPELVNHLDTVGIEFLHFSFRWMLCLMTRELTGIILIKLWDTYIAHGTKGFAKYHIYICAAFLEELSGALMETNDLGKCIYILQKPPTQYWDESNIANLIEKAQILKEKYPILGDDTK